MKKITAMIRPEKLTLVKEALNSNNIFVMTVSDARGCGCQDSPEEVFRGQEFCLELIPKVKLEIAVNDNFVDQTIDAIVQSARSGGTGEVGDGKIFIEPMEDCVRIRTGERGPVAIGP